mmetsp:Transcript_6257/g.7193  ORF Transcript_6257/g.7193 Transcript_6257/m.7193 type:complete len:282 (+) Transcript_6257:123-968(+)
MDRTDDFLHICREASPEQAKISRKRKTPGQFKVQADEVSKYLQFAWSIYQDSLSNSLSAVKKRLKEAESDRDARHDRVSSLLSEASKKLEDLKSKVISKEINENDFGTFKKSAVQILSERYGKVSKSWSDFQLVEMKRVLESRPNMYIRSEETATEFENIQQDFLLDEEGKDEELDIDKEMMAELALENESLLGKLEEQLSGAMQAEEQLAELSQLFSVFNEKLTAQRDMVEQIAEESKKGNENVRKGKEELIKTDNRYTNDVQVFLAFLIASILLIIYDW